MSLANRNIICHSCGKSYYKTTEKYNPDVALTGDMVASLQNLRDEHLWAFPEEINTKSGTMECPSCGSLLYHQNKVLLEKEKRVVKKITPEFNDIILQRSEEGKTPTQIADEFDFSRQAVGRRLYDLKKDK